MYEAKRIYYYDHGDYAVVHLAVLRKWFEYVSAFVNQAEIASASGLHRTTVWRFKSGKSVSPQSAYFLARGMQSLLADYPNLRFGLDDRYGVLLEVQTTPF